MSKDGFIEKYGTVLVKFCSYYKYRFTYKGVTNEGDTLFVDTGGDAGEIYKDEVLAGEMYSVSDLFPNSGRVYGDSGQLLEKFDE